MIEMTLRMLLSMRFTSCPIVSNNAKQVSNRNKLYATRGCQLIKGEFHLNILVIVLFVLFNFNFLLNYYRKLTIKYRKFSSHNY